MTLQGRIHNGVVVFDDPTNLPEGMPVTVEVQASQPDMPATDRLTENELRLRKAILDEILSLPNENPGDTFSGKDHDKVLYGEP